MTCEQVKSLTFVPDVTQLVNIRHDGHVGFQESVPHSYAPRYWEPPHTNAHNRTHVFSNSASPSSVVTSPCNSLSSVAWSDSVPSPTSHSRHHSHSDNVTGDSQLQLNLPPYPVPPSVVPSPTPHNHGWQHSDDAISESQLRLTLPPYPPSIPQMASPVYTESQRQQQQREAQDQPRPLEAPAPTTPPSVPSSPAPDSTPQDRVGRRAPAPAPKRRRITRAVQPLACYFCRGRKIACGPPTDSRSGGRTCEYVVTRLHLFL